jgi:host factor-I protein
MSADANDVQFAFVDGLVAEEKVVWVFLLSGIKLTGQLVWSDKYRRAAFKPSSNVPCPPSVLPTC